ncbi:hypothetical protein CFBP6600_16380 [Xanthomonas arboricola pv. corylina]|nr:hypothetical protein CFBP6600_16380 [Xanthomonas arboricola pv. corylina]CAE6750041.1 hypothetical protein CFBP6600_16380 [Xanthomonas arboricola pv. corylina]
MNLFATAMSLSMMAAVTPGGEEQQAIRVSKAGGAASAAGPADYSPARCASMRLSRPMRRRGWAAPR